MTMEIPGLVLILYMSFINSLASPGLLPTSSSTPRGTTTTISTVVTSEGITALYNYSQTPITDFRKHDVTTASLLSNVTDTAGEKKVSFSSSVTTCSKVKTAQVDIPNDNIEMHLFEGAFNVTGYSSLPEIYRAFIQAGKTPDKYTISRGCRLQLSIYYLGLLTKKGWAWNMYDSTGKKGAGILSGALGWPGKLDQCISTPSFSAGMADINSVDKMSNKFCSVYLEPPSWVKIGMEEFNLPSIVATPPLIGDVCTANACTEYDLHSLIQQYLNEESRAENFTVLNVKCYKERRLLNDFAALLSLSVISLLILLVLVGTAYEIYLRARRRGNKSSRDILVGTEICSTGLLPNSLSAENKTETENPYLTAYVYKNFVFDSDSQSEMRTKQLSNALENDHKREYQLGTEHTESGLPDDVNGDVQQKCHNINLVGQINGDSKVYDSQIADNSELETGAGIKQPYFLVTSETAQAEEYQETNPVPVQLSKILPSVDRNKKSVKLPAISPGLERSKDFPWMQKRHLKTQLSVSVEERPKSMTVLLQKILVAFSFRRNLTNVLGKGHADILFCLNGVRVLSICWIVLGSFIKAIFLNPGSIENHLAIVKLSQNVLGQPLINTSLAADTFFVLSGALYCYNFMKIKAKAYLEKTCCVLSFTEYLQGVIHRLFRVVPCYYIAIMIFTCLGPYMRAGDQTGQAKNSSHEPCRDRWWTNALFISNFYKSDDMASKLLFPRG